jgi:hypothetical protein
MTKTQKPKQRIKRQEAKEGLRNPWELGRHVQAPEAGPAPHGSLHFSFSPVGFKSLATLSKQCFWVVIQYMF